MSRIDDAFRARTKTYASRVIRFYVSLPKQRGEVAVLGKQLLRSGTSVASQVREASRARSNAEFFSKIGGALQEADESLLWLELLAEDCDCPDAFLLKETDELVAMFSKTVGGRR